MKIKSLMLTIVAFALASCNLAYAGDSAPTSLPVKFEFKDDGAHAFMPKMEVVTADPTIRMKVKVQDPNPGPSTPWSFAGYYSFCSKDSAAVVMNLLDRIEDFLNQAWLDLNLSAFAGPGASGQVLAGFCATLPLKIGKGLWFEPGFGVDGDIGNLKKMGVGVLISFRRSF